MALEEYKYLMIDSEDFWGYDSSTYNENNNWYAKAFIVSKEEVENKPSLITELNLMPCAMFFLIDVEDSQGFTPTRIRVSALNDSASTTTSVSVNDSAYCVNSSNLALGFSKSASSLENIRLSTLNLPKVTFSYSFIFLYVAAFLFNTKY